MSSENRYSYELPPAGRPRTLDWTHTALPVVVTVCLLAFLREVFLAAMADRARSVG